MFWGFLDPLKFCPYPISASHISMPCNVGKHLPALMRWLLHDEVASQVDLRQDWNILFTVALSEEGDRYR